MPRTSAAIARPLLAPPPFSTTTRGDGALGRLLSAGRGAAQPCGRSGFAAGDVLDHAVLGRDVDGRGRLVRIGWPIQRTAWPFEYVCTVLNVRWTPGCRDGDRHGELGELARRDLAAGEVDLGHLGGERAVVGLDRLGELRVLVEKLQPGGGDAETSRKPGGIFTAIRVVLALSISLGTRSVSTVGAPDGTTLGWMLTWASAVAGTASAATSATPTAVR